MSVKQLLVNEIEMELKSLEDIEFGSEEHKIANETIGKLLDRLNDMERIETESLDKKEAREAENELKVIQMAEDRKDRIIKNVLTGISVIGGLGLTIWGTNKTLKFEETGTITTNAGRAFISKLFSKK